MQRPGEGRCVQVAERGSVWLGRGVRGDRVQEEAPGEGRGHGKDCELQLSGTGRPGKRGVTQGRDLIYSFLVQRGVLPSGEKDALATVWLGVPSMCANLTLRMCQRQTFSIAVLLTLPAVLALPPLLLDKI